MLRFSEETNRQEFHKPLLKIENSALYNNHVWIIIIAHARQLPHPLNPFSLREARLSGRTENSLRSKAALSYLYELRGFLKSTSLRFVGESKREVILW